MKKAQNVFFVLTLVFGIPAVAAIISNRYGLGFSMPLLLYYFCDFMATSAFVVLVILWIIGFANKHTKDK